MKGLECLLRCPTCKADAGKPCRTPKGRIKKNIHDTRPFFIGKPPEAK